MTAVERFVAHPRMWCLHPRAAVWFAAFTREPGVVEIVEGATVEQACAAALARCDPATVGVPHVDAPQGDVRAGILAAMAECGCTQIDPLPPNGCPPCAILRAVLDGDPLPRLSARAEAYLKRSEG